MKRISLETADAKVCPLLPNNWGFQWSYLESGLSVLTVWGQPACNTEDPGSISGLGRSAGEGKGYPLQYSWAFLVAQLVKNPSAMWETWVRSLGWEDPQEKGKATHSSILAWRIPWTMGLQRVGHDWATKHSTFANLSDLMFLLCYIVNFLRQEMSSTLHPKHIVSTCLKMFEWMNICKILILPRDE